MKKLISIHEAAETLGISAWTLRRLVNQRQIRCVRVSKRVLIPSDEVERILQDGCKPLDPTSSSKDRSSKSQASTMRRPDERHKKAGAQ